MSDEKKVQVEVNYQWRQFCQVVVRVETDKTKIGSAARTIADTLVKAFEDMAEQPAKPQSPQTSAPEKKVNAADLTEIKGNVFKVQSPKHLKGGAVVNVTVKAVDGKWYGCAFWDVEGKKALRLNKDDAVQVAGKYSEDNVDGKTYRNLKNAILLYPVIEIGDEPPPCASDEPDDIPF